MWLRVWLFVLLAANARPALSQLTVQSQPVPLVNGSPVLFSVRSRKPLTALTGSWLSKDLHFSFDPRDQTWYALGGTALKTRPGVYTLKLAATSKRGSEDVVEKRIPVRAGKYRRIAIQVAKKFTEPDAQQARKIAADQSTKQAVFSRSDPEREWSGKFAAPVEAVVSDAFGTQRTFNGHVQSTHQGLDFAAGAGTPVEAVNSGTVLLAGPLYFEGNCVVLDHGDGLQTLYMHMSGFAVKAGDHVSRGQKLGLVGGTGRATGPHLHLGVRWRGEYLDPAALLKLKLPK